MPLTSLIPLRWRRKFEMPLTNRSNRTLISTRNTVQRRQLTERKHSISVEIVKRWWNGTITDINWNGRSYSLWPMYCSALSCFSPQDQRHRHRISSTTIRMHRIDPNTSLCFWKTNPPNDLPVHERAVGIRHLTFSHRSPYLDPLHHLFLDDEPENQLDPVYETIDHSPVMDSKNKAPSTNTFFSKTKDKLVTAVNKLVDNYGNVPKKQISQPRPNNNSSKEPYPSNEPKISTTKRQAPLAEHVLRRHEQTPEHATRSANDVTYENTQQMLSTPGATRRSSTSSSSNVTTAKNSVIYAHRGVSTIDTYRNIYVSFSFYILLPFFFSLSLANQQQ